MHALTAPYSGGQNCELGHHLSLCLFSSLRRKSDGLEILSKGVLSGKRKMKVRCKELFS